MKNLLLGAAFLLAAFFSAPLNAAVLSLPAPVESSQTVRSEPSEILIARLHEIKSMDKSDLNFSEKRQLRKETRAIKAQLREGGDGIYISAGALLIAVILLVLFL